MDTTSKKQNILGIDKVLQYSFQEKVQVPISKEFYIFQTQPCLAKSESTDRSNVSSYKHGIFQIVKWEDCSAISVASWAPGR